MRVIGMGVAVGGVLGESVGGGAAGAVDVEAGVAPAPNSVGKAPQAVRRKTIAVPMSARKRFMACLYWQSERVSMLNKISPPFSIYRMEGRGIDNLSALFVFLLFLFQFLPLLLGKLGFFLVFLFAFVLVAHAILLGLKI